MDCQTASFTRYCLHTHLSLEHNLKTLIKSEIFKLFFQSLNFNTAPLTLMGEKHVTFMFTCL